MILGNDRARRWLARIIHSRGVARRYWGHRLMQPEQHLEAVEDFARAFELDPTFVQALFDRGVLYWRELGDPQQAERDLGQVLELEPAHPEAHFYRALARQDRGDEPGASADFRAYLMRGTDPEWVEIARRQVALMHDGAADEERR